MAYALKRKFNNLTMYCETSTSFTLFEKQLLLPTLYGLNRSFTKKIIIGFKEQEDGCLYPSVRLIGNDYSGISFNTESWRSFQEQFNTVSEYLNGEYNVNGPGDQRITTQHFLIFFTISYGQRAIAIEKKSEVLRDEKNEESKKKKPYHYIIMQKITFDNLKEICVCVNERLNYLEKIIMCVNHCKDVLVKLLHTKIRENKLQPNLYTIKNLINTENTTIENQIRESLNIKFPTFTEQEFRMIFLELTTIYQFYILQCVSSYE